MCCIQVFSVKADIQQCDKSYTPLYVIYWNFRCTIYMYLRHPHNVIRVKMQKITILTKSTREFIQSFELNFTFLWFYSNLLSSFWSPITKWILEIDQSSHSKFIKIKCSFHKKNTPIHLGSWKLEYIHVRWLNIF